MVIAAPSIAQPSRSVIAHRSLIQWWHLLSLDAPTVASLWSWSFARAMGVSPPLYSTVILASGTWLVYVADRVLDGLRGEPIHLRPRHYFYARHRSIFIFCGAAVAIVLSWLIHSRMDLRALHEDTLLFAAALLYFLVIHSGSKLVKTWLPKELAVGILFAAATAVPAWSRLSALRGVLLPTVILFAALCWLNCVAIETWENIHFAVDHTPQNFTTKWSGLHLKWVALAIANISLLTAVWMFGVSRRLSLLDLAISLSALLLLVLDSWSSRVPLPQLRVAADLALLTPLVVMPLLG